MNGIVPLQRLALPLSLAQLAFAANTFTTNWFLARHSVTALHASLPGSMLAVAVSSLAISSLGYSGTVFAARHGSGDSSGALAAFRAALALVAASVPLFFLAAPAGHAILRLFNASAEVLAAESAYYDVLLANGFLTALAAVLGGYFTGQGKTRLVGFVTILGFLVNIAIAPAFIGGMFGIPVEGVQGAGWAATVAHAVPCAVLAAAIRLRPLDATARQIRRADFAELLRLGIPNGVRSAVDIGGFFAFTAVLAECPAAAAAASTAAFAANGIFQALPQGLAQAVEIATARTADATRRALLAPAAALVCVYAAAFCLVLAAFGTDILAGFAPGKDQAFADAFAPVARILVAVLVPKAVLEGMSMVLQAYLRGRGETAAVFRIQFASSALFWIPLYLTVRAICPSVPAYWLTMLACAALSTALLVRRAMPRRRGSS